jgi:hypothetical protein
LDKKKRAPGHRGVAALTAFDGRCCDPGGRGAINRAGFRNILQVLELPMTPLDFAKDARGAVTVNWLVLSAALIGIGLAAAALTTAGVEEISEDVATALAEQTPPGAPSPEAATEELAATAVWDAAGGASFRDLANVERFSFAMEVTFTADSDGILFEAGGRGHGTVLYQHDGVLYLQAGRGNRTGPASDRGEATWTVVEGPARVEGSLDANGGLALIVNGETVSQSSFTASRLAGGNAGSVGGAQSSVAANRGGFTRRDPGHPGVTRMEIFADQTTGDETRPDP